MDYQTQTLNELEFYQKAKNYKKEPNENQEPKSIIINIKSMDTLDNKLDTDGERIKELED